MNGAALRKFGVEYARHREGEGRAYAGDDLFNLPYLQTGSLARQWAVRAATFDAFLRNVLRPHAAHLNRPIQLLDLGAGNGWLSYRVALEGHRAMAMDIRDDTIDGLGAGAPFALRQPDRFKRLVAAFDAIPLRSASVDIAVFNAALHYSTDLAASLDEAARVVRPGGLLTILDTPFYRRERDGAAMVREKQASAAHQFGDRADALLALPFIEFLTRERLRAASSDIRLRWRRRRVGYPLWYEMRALHAKIRGKRSPSRFDLWTSVRP